jgi:hypothetical protein
VLPAENVTVNGVTLFACPYGIPPEVAVNPKPMVGPGDLLKVMIAAIGLDETQPCRCAERQQQMNVWWFEMYGDEPMTARKLTLYLRRHGKEIKRWLSDEAEKRGITPTPWMLTRGVAAGVRWWRAEAAKGKGSG